MSPRPMSVQCSLTRPPATLTGCLARNLLGQVNYEPWGGGHSFDEMVSVWSMPILKKPFSRFADRAAVEDNISLCFSLSCFASASTQANRFLKASFNELSQPSGGTMSTQSQSPPPQARDEAPQPNPSTTTHARSLTEPQVSSERPAAPRN